MSNLSAFLFETLSLTNKVISLTSKFYKGAGGEAKRVFITCDGECRYRYDGGEPSSVSGHSLRDGESVEFHGLQIENFKAIKTGAGICNLHVSYER